MENLWQFSKVYEEVPKSKQYENHYSKKVIWDWPKEIHVLDGVLTKKYHNWRYEGMKAQSPIRYPVGRSNVKYCKYSLKGDSETKVDSTDIHLNYIDARKQIYIPLYHEMIRKTSLYQDLLDLVRNGQKILIIEIDGPRSESLDYYKNTYNVSDDFIIQSSMIPTYENLDIMLNDTKHPFGHGYCLAMAVLEDLDIIDTKPLYDMENNEPKSNIKSKIK